MSYPSAAISEVANFINGFAFKPEDWGASGLPIIRIQNLTDKEKPYNFTERKVPKKYFVKNGDILVSWSATIDVFEWSQGNALLNQQIFKVDFDHERIDKQYFKEALRKTISDLSKYAHGSTMKHVVKKDFEGHQIPLPPLDDQKRIAHLLGKVEGLIARRKQHLQQLDELLKSVFLEMFGDPVRNEKEWDTVPFHKVGKFVSGGTPSKSRDDFWAGDFP
jgi:type I restriction enzyme S subunit